MSFGSSFASVADMGAGSMQRAAPNGRIDLLSPMPAFRLAGGYQNQAMDNTSYTKEALGGQMAETPLSQLYFSATNIEALHNAIRYLVFKETNRVIGRQSDHELRIIMRSIFFQYAKHQSQDIVGQVRELNQYVLDYAVPEVVSNLKQYDMYRRDASTLPIPNERPPLMTSKGSRQLEHKGFF